MMFWNSKEWKIMHLSYYKFTETILKTTLSKY